MEDNKKKRNPDIKISHGNYNTKEGDYQMKKKKVKINFFNILILFTAILAAYTLIHDFIFWGIIPAFTGVFYQLTYFGLAVDIAALFLLEVSVQFISEWFK